MSLLEIRVQLMTLATASFRIMNATPFWSSPQSQILCPPSAVVFPNPVHLTEARPGCPSIPFQLVGELLYFSAGRESERSVYLFVFLLLVAFGCFGRHRDRTFRLPICVPSFGSLLVVLAGIESERSVYLCVFLLLVALWLFSLQ